MDHIHKILIIRLSSIGDIILTTPLVRCLRKKYPDAQIDYLVKKEFAELIRHNPHITHIIEFDKSGGSEELKKKAGMIHDEKYDLLIDIHKSLRSFYLRLKSGARYKTTYRKYLVRRSLLVKTKMNFYSGIRQVFLRYLDSVNRFGVSYDGNGTEVFVPESSRKKIRDELYSSGFTGNEKIVVFCPGAAWANKRWPSEDFAISADYMAKQPGRIVVFAGGKSDTGVVSDIRNLMKNKSLDFTGQLGLLESAALLNEASAVVTNDSGLMHLAQSLKRPLVAIFGPTTKELGFYPLPGQCVVLENEVYCRPCTSRGLNYCPKKHFKCMLGTSPGEVVEAVEKLISHQN